MVASSLSLRAVPVAISLAILPNHSNSKGSYVVVDPTMEEEAKALARFGFAWAIGQGLNNTKSSKSKSKSEASGMDVDGDDLEMELVWTESEGSFSRSEVRFPQHTRLGWIVDI